VPLADFLSHPALISWVNRCRDQEIALGGGFPAGQAALIAALAQHQRRSLLAIAPRTSCAEEIASALDEWLGSEVADIFPAHDPATLAALQQATSSDPDEAEAGTALWRPVDSETSAQRLRVVTRLLGDSPPRVIIATPEALDQPLPDLSHLRARQLPLAVGGVHPPETLITHLTEAGYLEVPRVEARGQFARRGGVLDCFPHHRPLPLRIEWFGDSIESLREFDPLSQLTRHTLETCTLYLTSTESSDAGAATLKDFLPSDRWLHLSLGAEGAPRSLEVPALWEHAELQHAPDDPVLAEQRRLLIARSLREALDNQWTITIVCHNEGEEQRLRELWNDEALLGAEATACLKFCQAALLRGWTAPDLKWMLLTDAEIFGRYQSLRILRKRERLEFHRQAPDAGSWSDWVEGDYVVHLHHGIGKFRGIQNVDLGGEHPQEVLVLEYADQAKLYVPIEQAYLVARYIGAGSRRPEMDVLGGSRWERTRNAAHRAILDYAAHLLEIHAERIVRPGKACLPDTRWQKEFEDAFLYRETPDQLAAIQDAKRDMESERPMDRLVCGDVGFGKTEVAIRTAFKAVMSGGQVAFLCPTTVLAQQHARTLRERMADYPVRIECLSRFTSAKESRRIVKATAEGSVDILVGTQRILSHDVLFKNIQLLVVDEEQRFGVRHKDRLKDRFRQVDVLTLTATPIPRTLYLALMGARDMSTIETPPPGRVPIETFLLPFHDHVVRDAIRRELQRDGQVFFLHNRIETIEATVERLRALVPDARIQYAHGQMDDDLLEEIMLRFVQGDFDILVSTTIIESGLDIPRANTIFIDRADRFGLADLYQLRGRVGRGQHKAYAYLLLPPHLILTPDAHKRTSAIRQYSHLGAGFRIAMRDLEIRGSGNLLGTRQSGHVAAIGFDLYCQLLKQAVDQLKSGKALFRRDATVSLDFVALNESTLHDGKLACLIPRRFIRDPGLRIGAHRELAEIQTSEELDALIARWRDRFGRFPPEVAHLLEYHRIRVLSTERGLRHVETVGDQLHLKRGEDFIMIGTRFPRLSAPNIEDRLDEILAWIERLASPEPSAARPNTK
jgi:transcription-repair coupling factor (superfamily II helicase)